MRFSLVSIVGRSIRQHALSTCITVLSVGLGAGLTMAVFVINHQTYRAFTEGDAGFDAVLGARGSQLQLVLNTVFHLETSPGNIPWSMYKEMAGHPRVELAIPYAVGDSYQGYRVVGTIPELFTRLRTEDGPRFRVDTGGRVFDPERREAMVGSFVASSLGLKVGDVISPTHGIAMGAREHADRFTVTGILAPTSSPSDRVIWIPIDSMFHMSGHVLRGTGDVYRPVEGEEVPEEEREVSAVMLKFTSPQLGFTLSQQVNRVGKTATLAWPIARVMLELFERIGWVSRILTLVAYLIVVVAAGSILASLYNTMNERRREFAILRGLGARRRTVFSVIVLEATTISLLGALVGYGVYGAIMAAAVAIVRAQTGVVLDPLAADAALWLTPLGIVIVGALAGVVPAIKAYRTDVATYLTALT